MGAKKTIWLILAELDARLWQTLTERHGRPLEIELR